MSRLYPCVAISGRAQADAFRRLKGVEICHVIGNHGAEPSAGSAEVRRNVQRWLPILNARFERWPGVLIENKRFSLTIHYRQARERRAILAAARSLENVRIIGGRLAVNLARGGQVQALRLEARQLEVGLGIFDLLLSEVEQHLPRRLFLVGRHQRTR